MVVAWVYTIRRYIVDGSKMLNPCRGQNFKASTVQQWGGGDKGLQLRVTLDLRYDHQ